MLTSRREAMKAKALEAIADTAQENAEALRTLAEAVGEIERFSAAVAEVVRFATVAGEVIERIRQVEAKLDRLQECFPAPPILKKKAEGT